MEIQKSNSPTRARAPRRRLVPVLVPTVVVVAIAGVLGWSARPLLMPAREVDVVQAVFDRSADSQPEQSTGASVRNTPTVQAPGWLEAEPFITACTALADGVVESMHVLEGDYVEAGQEVARLVAEDSQLRLARAQAQLAEAEAMLAMAIAEQTSARSHWQDPVELERAVESGEAMVAEVQAELAQLPSLIASARATLTRLDEEAKRVRRSTQQGATNELELITADQLYLGQLAEVTALEARGPILEARLSRARADHRAAERDLDLRITDRLRVDAADAGVARGKAALERARAARDEAALELDRMVIRAPISGYVQRRLKMPGDKVVRMMDSEHSTHIVHLYDPKRLQVRVDVPLADAAIVYVGQPCDVVVEVLPDRVFRGEVLRITHEADLQKNTLQVKVRVIEPDPVLRPEMLTRVKFLPSGSGSGSEASGVQSAEASRVLVPAGAVVGPEGSPTVWTVTDRRNGRGVLTQRLVSILGQQGDWLTIGGDVQPGALLAVGLDEPREGERVVLRAERSGEGATWR